ncbi:SUKH-4 family immunity protein [Streptomyces sp. NPDC021080]|uniref:SUKH-4 family immunity protein n=1 Tax=Streptomyces sp. NPDC021080 TaxID=3365110 RepID=UPI0037AF5EE1
MGVIAGMLTRVESEDAYRSVQEALGRVLSQPVSCLVTAASRVAVESVACWDLPDDDRAALLEWGLPRLPLFTPHPQVGAVPTLLPNRVGAYERHLVEDGLRLYEVGHWGPDANSSVVAVVPGEGRVLCLRPAPITVDDLPEVLRPYNQGLHKPAVSFFSSSVAQYVETAWRWHAALRILRRIEEPEFTVGEAELLRHYDRLHLLVERVVDAAARIDPAVEEAIQPSVWIELIRENSV